MSHNCENLDAYLLDDLSADGAARFAEHLPHCDECREAVEQQRWMDGLLQSSATIAVETPSHNILVSLRTSIARRANRAKLIACGLAAAATIVVTLGWTALNRQASDQSHEGEAPVRVATNNHPNVQPLPRATFVASSNAIAVPVASRHPDVTVVRIYPTYQLRYEIQTAAIQPEAATHENWTSYSNGG